MRKGKTITVLGDGSFGTAFAHACALQGHTVTIWCYNESIAQEINSSHANSRYLPGITLHPTITATTDLQTALNNDTIFAAIPMEFLRSIMALCVPFHKATHYWISLTKGIEPENLFTATDIIQQVLGVSSKQVAVISGPSYARQLALQQPTGLVLATKSNELANFVIQLLNQPIIVKYSSDVQGVQLIAALKNVCAIAIGLLAGADYQSNTQILFFMQLLQELKIIGALYAIPELLFAQTLYGIAGIGDMVLTCFGKESRNYRFGYGIGQGKSKEIIIHELATVPEGVHTLKSIKKLEVQHNTTLPLFNCIERIVEQPSLLPELIQLLQCSLEPSTFCSSL